MDARWLTPNAPPPHKFFTRRLIIPAASDFLGLVNGALFELCQAKNWQQDGDMTPQEAADFFLALWNQYLVNENEPPTWDNAENVDGHPTQPWYEQLEDWIIQGFLAITFTPLAALVYQTTVPKIRVAIRTGNLGALFKVLINGVEVWTGDSYAPITDIIERVFDNPNPGTAATVHVIHDGNGGHYAGDVSLEFVRTGAVENAVQTILDGDPGGCGIRWSLDNGGSWNTIDLAYCISGLARDQIIQAIQDGVVAPGGQPGPGQPPGPGTCATYHGVLAPGARYLVPSTVSTGDSISLSNINGGWSIGELAWYCPDGWRYLAGICDHELDAHLEGDPLTSARHMQIIGLIGETFFDPLEGPYTVPAGVSNEAVYLLANTGLTGVPSGEAQFDVEVCTAEGAYWTYHFQFATGEHGFVSATSYNGCESLYYGGAWHNCPNAGAYYNVEISPPFWDTDNFNLRGLRMKGHQGGLRGDGGNPVGVRINGVTNLDISALNIVGDFDYSTSVSMDGIKLTFAYICTNYNVDSYITDLYVTGQGFCPYSGQ